MGFKWKINGQVYENTVPFSITVPTATEGTSRIDLAILNTANGIERLQGNESPSIALSPIAPSNTITLTSWNITGNIISNTSIDKSGRVFIYKTLVVYKIATNLLAGKLEVGDYCQGFVAGEFINANYLGGNDEQVESYDI